MAVGGWRSTLEVARTLSSGTRRARPRQCAHGCRRQIGERARALRLTGPRELARVATTTTPSRTTTCDASRLGSGMKSWHPGTWDFRWVHVTRTTLSVVAAAAIIMQDHDATCWPGLNERVSEGTRLSLDSTTAESSPHELVCADRDWPRWGAPCAYVCMSTVTGLTTVSVTTLRLVRHRTHGPRMSDDRNMKLTVMSSTVRL